MISLIARGVDLQDQLPTIVRVTGVRPARVIAGALVIALVFLTILSTEVLVKGPDLRTDGAHGILAPKVLGFKAQPMRAFAVDTGEPRETLYLGAMPTSTCLSTRATTTRSSTSPSDQPASSSSTRSPARPKAASASREGCACPLDAAPREEPRIFSFSAANSATVTSDQARATRTSLWGTRNPIALPDGALPRSRRSHDVPRLSSATAPLSLRRSVYVRSRHHMMGMRRPRRPDGGCMDKRGLTDLLTGFPFGAIRAGLPAGPTRVRLGPASCLPPAEQL